MAQLEVVEADQPMVLIAQMQRSGGTLLAQLFDGHPQLHGHPPELKLGREWPQLDLTRPPGEVFAALHERSLVQHDRQGYSKDAPARRLGLDDQVMGFPFRLSPARHAEIFLRLAQERGLATQRDALDHYFTALFSAWENYANAAGAKRWIVAFRGRYRWGREAFFRDYPDGRTIAVVRRAKSSLASKLQYQGVYREKGETIDLDRAIERWREEVGDTLAMRERYGERMFLLTYDQLVGDTQAAMRRLAAWLGIDFDPILLTPTFNRQPIKANSSFAVAAVGVQAEAGENWRKVYTDEVAAEIDRRTDDLYEAASRRSDVRGGSFGAG